MADVISWSDVPPENLLAERFHIMGGFHEAGWALSYHGISLTGKLVRASKYEGAGPFDLQLVERAVKVIRERYPINMIDGIVSVPPTISGTLVEDFARKVASSLGIAYLPVLKKVRTTQEQKYFTNYLQKTDNVISNSRNIRVCLLPP